MCDYSLQQVKSRPAVVGDKLVVTNFGTGTLGFAPAGELEAPVAVCVLPGTEIAFDKPIKRYDQELDRGCLAVFAQVNKEHPHMHHDALEFPDGKSLLLTHLQEGQRATVLQLPAAPKTEAEREKQRRAEYAG